MYKREELRISAQKNLFQQYILEDKDKILNNYAD